MEPFYLKNKKIQYFRLKIRALSSEAAFYFQIRANLLIKPEG